MPDFETLYHIMVNASENTIDALEKQNFGEAKRILIDAEQRAEEIYITSTE